MCYLGVRFNLVVIQGLIEKLICLLFNDYLVVSLGVIYGFI